MQSTVISRLIAIGLILQGANQLFGQTPRLDWTVNGTGNGRDSSYALAVNHQGNPVIAGDAANSITLSGRTFSQDGPFAFVAGLTPTGGVFWLAMLPGGGLQRDAAIDADDNIYVCGAFATNLAGLGMPNGPMDGYVAKYNSTGTLLWLQSLSGDGAEVATSLALDIEGNCYVGGTLGRGPLPGEFEGIPVSTADGGYSSFLIKLSPNGSKLHTKLTGRFADESGGYASHRAIAIDAQGNCYLAGDFRGPVSFDGIILGNGGSPIFSTYNEGAFLAKYDTNWNIVWARSATGSTQSEESPTFTMFRDVKLDRNGNAFVTGIFTPHLTIGTNELVGEGDWDIVIAKFSAEGDVLWAQRAGAQGNDSGERLAITDAGDCVVVGYFQGESSFAGTNVTSRGRQDLFAAAYDGNGDLVWLTNLGTNNTAYFGGGIGLASSGDIFLAGAVVDDPILNEIGIVENWFVNSHALVAKLSTGSGSQNASGSRLSVTLEGGQIVVSWPKSPVDLILESAHSTQHGTADWQTVNAVAETDPDRVIVRFHPDETVRFFRLKKAQ
jgi:hypothetical protein